MKVNLVIPRHKYRSLDGQRRESISLSPEGKAALDRLATCSRSAAVDFLVRMGHAVVFGDCEQIELIGQELAGALDSNDSLAWVSAGLDHLATTLTLNANLKIELSDEN